MHLQRQAPTSWIVFLFVTGFAFIGYGVHSTRKTVENRPSVSVVRFEPSFGTEETLEIGSNGTR